MAYDLIHILKRIGFFPDVLVLVGAWDGNEVKTYLKEGVSSAFLFEAEPSALEILKNKFGQDFRVKIFAGAVSSQEDRLKDFNVMNHGSSSLLRPNLEELGKILPDFEVTETIKVRTITLDASLGMFFDERNVRNTNSLLILDIQGAEADALLGATKTLKSINIIMTEISKVDLYHGQGTLKEIDELLENNNFVRISTRIYPKVGHGDALYFKKDSLSLIKIMKIKIEDAHWYLAKIKPSWLPSLSSFRIGQTILFFLIGKKKF